MNCDFAEKFIVKLSASKDYPLFCILGLAQEKFFSKGNVKLN